MYCLETENLTVDYGNFRMEATAKIPKGLVTGLIGRNGAGKSTFIRTIMRQQTASFGKTLYDGMPFKGNEATIFSKTACVFDELPFNFWFAPKTIVKTYASIYPNFDMNLFNTLMDNFRLGDKRKIKDYSFGEKKKFCLILALAQKPEFLVLDEPTAGIDPIDRNNILELIQTFMLDENRSVLFSTHITEDLDKIADHIIMMENGRMVLDGDKEELLEEYRIVSCINMTDEMAATAVTVRKTIFGYVFLTKKKDFSGDGVSVRRPTVEELFMLTDENKSDEEFGEITL